MKKKGNWRPLIFYWAPQKPSIDNTVTNKIRFPLQREEKKKGKQSRRVPDARRFLLDADYSLFIFPWSLLIIKVWILDIFLYIFLAAMNLKLYIEWFNDQYKPYISKKIYLIQKVMNKLPKFRRKKNELIYNFPSNGNVDLYCALRH